MKQKNKNCLLKYWKFINQPLPSALIIILISFSAYIMFVKSEKVYCIFNIKLNYEMFDGNWTRDDIRFIEKLLRDKYTYNMTFESYQEALSFEHLAFNELERSKIPPIWKYHFWCGTNRTLEPSNIQDFLKRK